MVESRRGRQLASLVRAGGRAKNMQQTTFEVAIGETARGPLVLVMWVAISAELSMFDP